MTYADKAGSHFIVDLGDVKLPPVVEKQVEAEIQAVVLRAVAECNPGEQRAAQEHISRTIWDQFAGRTLGLWPGYPNNPPDIFGSGGGGPLGVEDHTLIMKAIMDHPLQVIRYLPKLYKSKTDRRPSGKEVLEAALQVNQIDDYVKARIRAVLDLLPKIEDGQAALPESVKQAVDGLRRQLSSKRGDEKLRLLKDPEVRKKLGDSGLPAGMDVAARILEHGRDSIYSPDHGFFNLLQEGASTTAKDSVDDIKDADAIGATFGGFFGTFVMPVVGTTAGAVAGAASASAGQAVSEFFDWLFD